MRIFTACVVAILGASVVADHNTCSCFAPAYPRIYLPPNPTSAEYFDATVSSLTETVRYGIHALVFIRNLTIPTPYYDNRVVTRNFTETVDAFDHFKYLLSSLTRNGMKKLREEISGMDRAVGWGLIKLLYEHRIDDQFAVGDRNMSWFSNQTREIYFRFKYILETGTWHGSKVNRHNVVLANKAAIREHFPNLYYFNIEYKQALLMWHACDF
uniref:Uncharacterized protein n=1 Tax=Panagrellus redivivus TaxID=6233 RepID=A0A7E4VG37_PANRE